MSSILNPHTLTLAYAQGYFPMPDPVSGEIAWFRPDPRAIIPLHAFHCPRSLHRSIRKYGFRASIDQDFSGVMDGCAARADTWITSEFKDAYYEMFRLGLAHSIEVWRGDQLAGGLYGVHLGGAFFAESKFHRHTDASKYALYYLVEQMRQNGFQLLEVQFITEHLRSLGAIEIPADDYLKRLQQALKKPACFTANSSSVSS